jgi:hypothetical protein
MILINRAQCLLCGDVIESHYTHDFTSCHCGNISVDGGHDYLRRVAKTDEWKDLSIETKD